MQDCYYGPIITPDVPGVPIYTVSGKTAFLKKNAVKNTVYNTIK